MVNTHNKIFKNEPYVTVYQRSDRPSSIFKKYIFDNERYETIDDLILTRERLIAISEHPNWPSFVSKPKKVYKLYNNSFKAEFPYIAGETLDDYIYNNNISFASWVKFISELEKKIMSVDEMVFSDVANANNIIMSKKDDNLNFTIIDPDDIQFGEYESYSFASLLGMRPWYGKDLSPGVKKCTDGISRVNKQLDLRSMYALFYYLFNTEGDFYPSLIEKENEEYMGNLRYFNIPEGSILYKQTLATLSDDEPNLPISSALYELLDAGYTFNSDNAIERQLVNRHKIY